MSEFFMHRPKQLTARQRDEIRRRLDDGEKPKDLALEYRVSVKLIRAQR